MALSTVSFLSFWTPRSLSGGCFDGFLSWTRRASPTAPEPKRIAGGLATRLDVPSVPEGVPAGQQGVADNTIMLHDGAPGVSSERSVQAFLGTTASAQLAIRRQSLPSSVDVGENPSRQNLDGHDGGVLHDDPRDGGQSLSRNRNCEVLGLGSVDSES